MSSGLKDDFLLTSSYQASLIIEKNFEVLKLCEMHFVPAFTSDRKRFVDVMNLLVIGKKTWKTLAKIHKFCICLCKHLLLY